MTPSRRRNRLFYVNVEGSHRRFLYDEIDVGRFIHALRTAGDKRRVLIDPVPWTHRAAWKIRNVVEVRAVSCFEPPAHCRLRLSIVLWRARPPRAIRIPLTPKLRVR